MTKEYMQDFFNRNLTRPTMEKFTPSYLKPFKFIEKEDPHELFLYLMANKYNITEEEQMLTNLYRSLGQRGDTADKIIEKLGIIGFNKKMLEKLEEQAKQSSQGADNNPKQSEINLFKQLDDLNFDSISHKTSRNRSYTDNKKSGKRRFNQT